MTRTSAALAGLVALATGIAAAQGALDEGIVTGPGGLCLDVEGTWSNAVPPPDGTPLVLAPCSGADDQRWSQLVGDWHGDFIGVGYVTLVRMGNHAVTARVDHTLGPEFLGSGPIRFRGDAPGCLTSSAPPVAGERLRIETCDGRAGQSFTLVR